jgi:hypothetical protein
VHTEREEALTSTKQQQQLMRADLERVLQQRASLEALRLKLSTLM